MFLLVSFSCTWHAPELSEEVSAGELSWSDWSVCMSMGHFRNCWLAWEAQPNDTTGQVFQGREWIKTACKVLSGFLLQILALSISFDFPQWWPLTCKVKSTFSSWSCFCSECYYSVITATKSKVEAFLEWLYLTIIFAYFHIAMWNSFE